MRKRKRLPSEVCSARSWFARNLSRPFLPANGHQDALRSQGSRHAVVGPCDEAMVADLTPCRVVGSYREYFSVELGGQQRPEGSLRVGERVVRVADATVSDLAGSRNSAWPARKGPVMRHVTVEDPTDRKDFRNSFNKCARVSDVLDDLTRDDDLGHGVYRKSHCVDLSNRSGTTRPCCLHNASIDVDARVAHTKFDETGLKTSYSAANL